MEKILVTGAGGFVGTSCLRILKDNEFEIFATDINCDDGYQSGIRWIKNDLNNFRQTRNLIRAVCPDLLLHLAWGVDSEIKKNIIVQKRWIDSSFHLIKLFKKYGGRRIVVSGTCAEYQWGQYDYDEEYTPLIPSTVYGLYKNKLHNLLAEFSRRNNLYYAWGRLFYLYGPNDNEGRIVPQVIKNIKMNVPVKTTHGNQVYDYLYVDDVARALIMLLHSSFNGPVNICSGKSMKLKELIFEVANQLNGSHLVRLDSIKFPADHPDYIVGINSRLKHVTEWQQQVDIQEGVKRTIQSFLLQ